MTPNATIEHKAMIQRHRSKTRNDWGKYDTLYARGYCPCGWRGTWNPTRQIEGLRLAERDAEQHVRAEARPTHHLTQADAGTYRPDTVTAPAYGTVEYFTAKLATEANAHDRRLALIGRLRACVEVDDLETVRNLLAAYDQLAEAVSGDG